MKKIFIYIFLVFIFSCSSTKQKKNLIGNWYSAKENKIDSQLQFHKDSLVIFEFFGKRTLKWNVKGNKIYSSYLKEKGPTFKYQLDENNKVLKLELIGNNDFKLQKFMKANNAFEFFQKNIDLKIDIPESKTKLKPINQPRNLNFNIYAGYKNDSLVVKTDSTPNLDNLEEEVNQFKDNSRDELKRFLRFNLIADKNITESQIDSIKLRLKKTSIKLIFRTYKSKQINYKESLNWFGKIE